MGKIDKRAKLIQTGQQIIVQQGFKAAGLNQILTAAEVPKGSFYYYFPSKDDFGLAIIDSFAEQYQQKLQRIFNQPNVPHLQRLRNYFASGIADMQSSECSNGCLMGNLAQELSAQNEIFRDRLSEIFLQWEQVFVDCLEAAQANQEIPQKSNLRVLAKFILAGWQGAILQAKVSKSVEPMESFVAVLFASLLVSWGWGSYLFR